LNLRIRGSGVIEVQAGYNITNRANFDLILWVKMKDEEALDFYQAHPVHVKVRKKISHSTDLVSSRPGLLARAVLRGTDLAIAFIYVRTLLPTSPKLRDEIVAPYVSEEDGSKLATDFVYEG
jgi:Stress responsive A/B Barrel Domain